MNIYLISQTENTRYDTYDSAVVIAPDEKTARRVDPGNSVVIDKKELWNSRSWASSPRKVKVQCLGVAASDQPIGVVCASFNAG